MIEISELEVRAGCPGTVSVMDGLVAECIHPDVAAQRAAEWGEQAGFGVDPFFEASASRVLSALLLAAALGGHRISDVQRWLRDPAESTAVTILRNHPDLAPAEWVEQLEALPVMPAPTSAGVLATAQRALRAAPHL